MSTKQKIVVVGGGFAGLNFVKKIDKSKFDIILVDKHNYHTFPPLFYQVASSELDPTSICFPLRRELRKRNCHGTTFHIGKVRNIDVAAKQVSTDYETIHYDKLVMAIGTTNNFFGNNSLIDNVYTLKSTDQAIRIRNEILFRCERAAVETDREKRRRMLSFVVIGGGPAGVEIAGAVGELKRYILKRDYPGISPDELSITIVEGADRLLGTMSREASDTALRDLGQLMVDVRLGRLMKTYNENVITLD
ncbi:MAG: FAD-dependent oxidoreductase, partial [Duncaniella sp.]|nr:FAD-dependent oxidoreductase [Duncaniella sp.]